MQNFSVKYLWWKTFVYLNWTTNSPFNSYIVVSRSKLLCIMCIECSFVFQLFIILLCIFVWTTMTASSLVKYLVNCYKYISIWISQKWVYNYANFRFHRKCWIMKWNRSWQWKIRLWAWSTHLKYDLTPDDVTTWHAFALYL